MYYAAMFAEVNWPNLALFLIVAITANRLYYIAKNAYLLRKWNTGTPKAYRTGFLGLLYVKKLKALRSSGYFQDYLKLQYDELDTNTFTQSVLGQKVIVTRSPQNMKAALSTQFDDFGIGPRRAAFRPLLGNGVFAADGHQWKDSRMMLRPQFTREQVGHVKALEHHLQTFVLIIRKQNGQPFDIQPIFSDLTLDASTEFLLGESVHFLRDRLMEQTKKSQDDEISESYGPVEKRDSEKCSDYDFSKERVSFENSLKRLLEVLAQRASLLKYYWLIDFKSFREDIQTVHDFALRFVQQALAMSPEELEFKSRDSYTILYELVKVSRDPIVVRDQMLNVMLAGRSTTASLLTSTIFELSRHPKVWQRLRQEVISYFGLGESPYDLENITFESLKRCTYLKWVINETLRLYPPVGSNFRMARRDTTLPNGGGPNGTQPILVNKGQIVAFHIYSVQRLREFFGEDAETYLPERWANLSKIGWAFMPFGSGPRVCLGQQFALTETSYVIVRLAQLFPEIASFSDTYPPRKTPNATMQHMDGVQVSFK